MLGVADWGFDFAHPDLRHADGRTRLLGLWDQRPSRGPPRTRTGTAGVRPGGAEPALAEPDPYAALRYHPADFDTGLGAHGTHTVSIAAGNGRGGGPVGDRAGGGRGVRQPRARPGPDAVPLGSSVSSWRPSTSSCGRRRPAAGLNLSLGRHAGEHTGRRLVERAMDHFVSGRPGR